MIARQKQPRPYPRSRRYQDQEPLPGSAALIRDNVSARRQELDERSPEAVDLAARVLGALHEALHGQAARLSADRTPRYRRAQLLGERALPTEDLCVLVAEAPDEVIPAIELLAEACGRTLAAAHGDTNDLHLENSEFLRALGEFEGELSEALSTGRIEADRRGRLRLLLARLLKEGADLHRPLREVR